jgi:hypothetical protein
MNGLTISSLPTMIVCTRRRRLCKKETDESVDKGTIRLGRLIRTTLFYGCRLDPPNFEFSDGVASPKLRITIRHDPCDSTPLKKGRGFFLRCLWTTKYDRLSKTTKICQVAQADLLPSPDRSDRNGFLFLLCKMV